MRKFEILAGHRKPTQGIAHIGAVRIRVPVVPDPILAAAAAAGYRGLASPRLPEQADHLRHERCIAGWIPLRVLVQRQQLLEETKSLGPVLLTFRVRTPSPMGTVGHPTPPQWKILPAPEAGADLHRDLPLGGPDLPGPAFRPGAISLSVSRRTPPGGHLVTTTRAAWPRRRRHPVLALRLLAGDLAAEPVATVGLRSPDPHRLPAVRACGG